MVSLVLFVACLAQQTVSVETLTQRAQESFKLGKYSEAREALQQALQQSPRRAGLWKYLGLVEAQLNHVDAAITDFEKALSLAPGDAQTHFDLGLLYRRKNDSTKALASYRQGLQLQASNAPGLQNYALLLMETGQFKDAIAPLKTLRKVSTDLSVRVALIECYLNSGENDEAQREIHAFFQAPNATAADQLKLAKVLVEDRQPQAAQLVLEHVVTLLPDSAESHALLGMVLANKNEYERAAQEVGRAVQLTPDSAEYSMRLAEILILWKHYATALEFLTAVQPRFGTLMEYKYKLGLVYYSLPRIPQAIAIFDDLARERPDLDLVQFFLANCYQTTGDYEKAEPHYKKAIELNPKQASYYTALAQLLRKQSKDRTEETLVYLEKALQLDPKDVQSKLELAFCHEKKLNYPRAETLLEEVVQLQPDLLQAHVGLARVYYRQKKKEKGDREKTIVARLEAQEQAEKLQGAKPVELP